MGHDEFFFVSYRFALSVDVGKLAGIVRRGGRGSLPNQLAVSSAGLCLWVESCMLRQHQATLTDSGAVRNVWPGE